MNADSVRIESDDHGFELHVVDENGEHHCWNIHGIAEEVYDTVKREIGPWLQERDLIKASYDRGEGPNGEPSWKDGATHSYFVCDDPEGDWIEMQRAHADHQRKAEKENRP